MKIDDQEKIEKKYGTASTILADEFIPPYVEKVEKFLRDNESSMGDKWVKEIGRILYSFQGKDEEGNLMGSSTTMNVAIATFLPEVPLITGKQLLGIYKRNDSKNPFKRYIDFGIQIHGDPKVNSSQTKILLEDLKKANIDVSKEAKFFDFNQLRLITDKNCGLAYKLSEEVTSENVTNFFEFPFKESLVGKNGLFGCYLDGYSVLVAGNSGLFDSDDRGRVVRYDAEGVAPKKLPLLEIKKKDLIQTLKEDFLSRF